MDYSTSPPSPATLHRHKILKELSKGQRAVEFLRRRYLRAPSSPPLPGPDVVDDQASDSTLVDVISKSFNISLAILNNCDPLSLADDCKFEDSGERGDDSPSRIKDRRGCYKRRKRGQSWTSEGEAPTEDGYQWRKYGQKMILNSLFPRNYYRCTHKMDHGCQAVKQVQKTSDEPPHYKTTYSGRHTCKSPHKAPQIIIPSASGDPQTDSCFLLSFDRAASTNNVHNNIPFFQSSHNNHMAVKQESLANAVPNQALVVPMMPVLMNNNSSSNSDYNYLSSTPVGSDHGGDVISIGEYSCSASPGSLEIGNYMIDDLSWDDI